MLLSSSATSQLLPESLLPLRSSFRIGRRTDADAVAAESEKMESVDCNQVIATLRAHESELKGAGVVRLGVFGSVARGENSSASDVDIVVEFDETSGGVSLLDLVHLEKQLSDLLGVNVDLVQRKSLKPRIRQNVEDEAVIAF